MLLQLYQHAQIPSHHYLYIQGYVYLFPCAINGEIRGKIVTFVNLGHNYPRVVGRLELSKDQNLVIGVTALHSPTETFSWQC